MEKKELKELAESLGIEVDGRWSEKRIQEEIDKLKDVGSSEDVIAEDDDQDQQEDAAEQSAPDGHDEDDSQDEGLNEDGLTPGQHIDSSDLLRMMAEQRNKTGKLNAYTKHKGHGGKVHGEALDKAK